jgi:uncharacterized damage-inducible protein DinB
MKKYFLKLYQFNAWANDQVMECLKRQEVNHDRILSLMGHILAAQLVWLHRIKGIPPPAVVLWGNPSLEELTLLCEKAGKQWLAYIEAEENFDRELHYKNFAGHPFISNVEMIIIHVVNHSTYHRAQIAMLLRQSGMEPVNTDFIMYDRVMAGK